MALINCVECGHQISDKAKTCTNCGCPVEVTLNALKVIKEVKKAEIINRFDILGEEFSVTEKSDKFIRFSALFYNYKPSYLSSVKNTYYELGNIDSVIEKFPKLISFTLKKMVDAAIETMNAIGVYDYDEISFYQKYCECFDTESIMKPIIDRYLQILNYEEGLKRYHDQIKQSRSHRWKGGGFSIKGALEGYLEAQLLNAGNAVLHSIPDSVRRNADMETVNKAKWNLYRDENTIEAVLNAMEKIYDSVFDAMLIELVNADKITNVVVDKTKSNSIINNVIRLANENNISYENMIKYCKEAFFADPTSCRTVETIILLGIDESGDVTRYAKEYDFYRGVEEREKIDKEQQQENLRKKHSEEIIEVHDRSGRAVTNNDELSYILNTITKLVSYGLDLKYHFDLDIKDSITSRLSFSISHKEKDDMIKQIKKFDSLNHTSYYNDFKNQIENIEESVSNSSEIAEIIKNTCESFKHKDTYLYKGDKQIKSEGNLEYCYEIAEVPETAKTYVLYEEISDSSSTGKKIIVITDLGLFASINNDRVQYDYGKSWSEFQSIDVRYNHKTHTVFFGAQNIEINSEVLAELLQEIQARICLYLYLTDEDTIREDEKEPQKAKQEIESIKKLYIKYDYMDAYKHTLELNITTKSGIDVIKTFGEFLIKYYQASVSHNKDNSRKTKYLIKLLISGIITIVFIIIWVMFFTKLAWFWNIGLGIVALILLWVVGENYLKFKNEKRKHKKDIEEIERFHENFEIQGEKLILKKR